MKKISKVITLITILLMTIYSFNTQTVSASVSDSDIYVTPGGEPFGIKMFSDGLIVIKLEDFKTPDGNACPGKSAGLKINDIIYSANNQLLSSNEQLKQIIENCNGNHINLKIKRDKEYIDVIIEPQKNTEGLYKAGMWVKDSAAGLGTITFYDDKNNTFCGLGHGICDNDTKSLIPISYGEVSKANISSVTNSSCGKVGTLNGYFTDEILGKVNYNHETGIYGIITSSNKSKDKIKIADKSQVKRGKAYIYTTISGETPEKYEVEITKIDYNHKTINMTVKITDKRLLKSTGGIVKGMSGSPIIQNNELVGALTHVLVDKVDCGYGIFASTMYQTING